MARERNEICKVRKDSGLSCNGCQYTEGCEILKKEAEELPEDIKPGTKQAKIYRLLKEGPKWKKRCEVLLESLRKARTALEEGEIVETYKQMQQMIEFLEAVK